MFICTRIHAKEYRVKCSKKGPNKKQSMPTSDIIDKYSVVYSNHGHYTASERDYGNTTAWMNLKGVMLSKRSQIHCNEKCIIPFVYISNKKGKNQSYMLEIQK